MARKPTYEELGQRVKELEKNAIALKRVEESLLQERNFSESIIDSLPGIFYFFDDTGKFLRWNKNLEKVSSYSAEEILNMSPLDFFQGEDRNRVAERIKEVFEKGESSVEADFVSKYGIRKPYYFSGMRLTIDQRTYLAGMGIDMAARKQAEEALKYFESAVTASSDAIGMSTPEGKHWYQNKAFDDLFGEIGSDPPAHLYVDEPVGREVFKTIMNGNPWSGEVEMYGKDGNKLQILLRAYAVKDNYDRVKSLVGLHTDITERKQVEEELEKLALVVKYSSELVNLATLDGKMIFLNEAGSKMLGVDLDKVEQVHIMEVIPDHLKGLVQTELLPALMEGNTWEGDLQYRNIKTGDLTDVHAMTFTVQEPNTQKPLFLANVSLDISERKRAEEALRQGEEKYKSFIENAPVAMYTINTAGEFTYGNKKLLEMTGYKEEDWLNKPFHPIVHPEDIESVVKKIQDRIKDKGTADPYEIRIFHSSGEIMWVKINSESIYETDEQGNKNLVGMQSFVEDITLRKQAEDALLKNERFLQSVFDGIQDGISVLSPELNIIRVNQWMEKIYSDQKPLIGKKCYEVYQQRKDICPWCPSVKVIKTGEPQNEIVPYPTEEDPKGWFDLSAFPIQDAEGRVTGVIEHVKDITDRKRAEIALSESEEKYRTVLETSLDPIVVYDMKGKVTYFNPAFTRTLGWTLEERLGKKLDLFVPDDAWSETQKMIEKVLAGESFSGFETRRYTKEGDIVNVNMSAAIYKDQDGNPIGSVINLRDITDQKKLEGQLQQAQKMEAIGTLAGGIAHDFNNLLMGIQGRTSLMLMDTESCHPHSEHLRGIEDYVKSASDLTKQLLAFARGGKYEVKPIDLNELLNQSSEMFGRTKKEITIHPKNQQDIWTVEVDQSQIEQVLLNLYVNAWQSMPGGGELYLTTENVILNTGDVKPYSIAPGKYVKVSVTDTGVGMDKATQERIFDPFFTTKEMGRGTGLGLASAYGTIKNHNGFIDVHSTKGEGTTFNLYLPASEKEIIRKLESDKELKKGEETVLLVDDEEMIIEVGKELLKRMGYKVLIAKSGKAAVELYEANRDEIDIVILDMIMPDMGGGDTYDKLKENDSDIKVLLSSGYSVDGQATEILERGCNGFIQKPFKMIDLSQKIRGILDKD